MSDSKHQNYNNNNNNKNNSDVQRLLLLGNDTNASSNSNHVIDGLGAQILGSLVSESDTTVDEEEEEREFQRLSKLRGAMTAVGEDDVADDMIDDDNSNDVETPKEQQQQQQQRRHKESHPRRRISREQRHNGTAVSLQIKSSQQSNDQQQQREQTVFSIEERHISGHTSKGKPLIKFTELFAPLRYKYVGVDPFVKQHNSRQLRQQQQQQRRHRIRNDVDIDHDEDHDEIHFLSNQVHISGHQMERLMQPTCDVEIARDVHRMGELVAGMQQQGFSDLLVGDDDSVTDDFEDSESRVQRDSAEQLRWRVDRPLFDQVPWEDMIIWGTNSMLLEAYSGRNAHRNDSLNISTTSSKSLSRDPVAEQLRKMEVATLEIQTQQALGRGNDDLFSLTNVAMMDSIMTTTMASTTAATVKDQTDVASMDLAERERRHKLLFRKASDGCSDLFGMFVDPGAVERQQKVHLLGDKLKIDAQSVFVERSLDGMQELDSPVAPLPITMQRPALDTKSILNAISASNNANSNGENVDNDKISDPMQEDDGFVDEEQQVEDGVIPTLSDSAKNKGKESTSQDDQQRKSYYQRKKERERLKLMNESLREKEILAQRRTDQGISGLLDDDDDDGDEYSMNANGNSKRRKATRQNDADQLSMAMASLSRRLLNVQIIGGDWMDTIIWDSTIPPKRLPDSRLILDPKDQHMIFQEIASSAKLDARVEQNVLQVHNPYNLSNDRTYDDANDSIINVGQKRTHIVQHSLPAQLLDQEWFKTHLTNAELRCLHRPRYPFKPGEICRVSYRPSEVAQQRRKQKEIKKKKHLSAHDHRVVLLEHAEQHPPVLSNVGMGSMIINYYKKLDDQESVLRFEDGQTVLIKTQEDIPLLGPLLDGKHFTSIENSLYNSQLFKHSMAKTDFMLTTRKTPEGLKFFIREIPTIYSVGHTQPKQEIPQEKSRVTLNFTKNRLAHFLFSHFARQNDAGQTMKIRIDDIKEAFPTMSETTIRKQLKECSKFQRRGVDSGWWSKKLDHPLPTDHELKLLVTPDMICLNESMQAGYMRLKDATVTDQDNMAAFNLSRQRMLRKREMWTAIRFVEREKNRTPWDKSVNFTRAYDVKEGADIGLLEVTLQNLTKEEMDRMKKAASDAIQESLQERNSGPGGSSGALPNISNDQAKKILVEQGGYSEERVKRMTIADRKTAALKVLQQQQQQQQQQQTDADGGARKNSREYVKIRKFREVLQQIFAKEAYKLNRGLRYYPGESDLKAAVTHDNTGALMVIESLVEQEQQHQQEQEQRRRGGSHENDDMSDDEDIDRALDQMLHENEGDFSMNQNQDQQDEELMRLLEEDMSGDESDSSSSIRASSVTSPMSSPVGHMSGRNGDGSVSVPTTGPTSRGLTVVSTGIAAAFLAASMQRAHDAQRASERAELQAKRSINVPGQKRRRTVVRRTITIKNRDGTVEKKVEYYRDPESVEYYRRKKAALETGESFKKENYRFLDDSSDKFQSGMKERRKMQDQKRRFRRMKERHNRTKTGRETRSTLVSGADATRIRRVSKQQDREERVPKRKGRPRKSNPLPPTSNTNVRTIMSDGFSPHSSASTPTFDQHDDSSSSPHSATGIKIAIRLGDLQQQQQKNRRSGQPSARHNDGRIVPPLAKRPRQQERGQRYEVFARILKSIVELAQQQQCAEPFAYPVDPAMFPDYNTIVRNPIDLDTMGKRVNSLYYRDLRSFTDDIQLMVDNAVLYCSGQYDFVIQFGRQLQTFMLNEIDKLRDQIEQALQNQFLVGGVVPDRNSGSLPPPTQHHQQFVYQHRENVMVMEEEQGHDDLDVFDFLA